jgi:OHCU decarboxylase
VSDGVARLNGLTPEAAAAALLACCGSRAWARRMAAERPYASRDAVLATADRVWEALAPADWLEAFAAHPRIGERSGGEGDHRRWSAEEQAGTAGASESVLSDLAEANRVYHQRFGFLFIVCASGKSSGEMLGLLRARLANDPQTELRIAAAEQAKITRLRLVKWMEGR